MLLVVCVASSGCNPGSDNGTQRLLHVSYDPTREFFDAYNRKFAERWKREQGSEVAISQSHGGSGKQARAVIEGLRADVVSLALAFDIDQISKSGAIASDWQSRLPEHSSPFYSTIVFLVRRDNPRKIFDWGDLVRAEIEIIMPNPKISGGARWNYLAAWGYALERHKKSEEQAEIFMRAMLANVPVFDSGARGSATTFVERELGDVLLTWENDARLILASDRGGDYQIVYPSISVRAEPVVAVVDRTVEKRGTRLLASEYLRGLYRADTQELLTAFHFRSIDDSLMTKKKDKFPPLKLMSIDDFSGWPVFQKRHFSDGGVFDRLQEGRR